MGKYSSYMREKPTRKREVHPIWRGIGLLLIILIPIISYAGTIVLLQQNAKNNWILLPADLIAPAPYPLLYVKIILTLVIMFVLYALFMLVNFIVYSLVGPSSMGPTDVPQVTYRSRRRK